jgi:DNA-binding LacI/PurR family transcriptional regulator
MTQARTQTTLKDVARAADCSTAVVSTVINRARGNTFVSSELRKRVEAAARELGYRPNFASRSLVSNRTRTLGVYIPPAPWAGPGFSYDGEILKGIEPACRARGYDLLLINLTGNQAPQACLDKFAERRIDGVLLVHAEPGSPWIGDLVASGHNVVAIDYANPEPGLNAMVFDNPAVSRMAVDHLMTLGHRKIGFLGSCMDPVSKDGMARQMAFLDYARQRGLEVRPEWVFDAMRSERALRPEEPVCEIEGVWGARHILKLGAAGPTAWLAYGDMVAVHAMRHLQAAGVRVPEDVSLIGVDDSEWCRMVTPQLSSIGHPLSEMGRRAVELLIQISENDKAVRGVHEVFAPRLAARGTTAPLATS